MENQGRLNDSIFHSIFYQKTVMRGQGYLQTSRGKIMTPAFMPVGTAGTVKGLYMDQVAGAGSDIILGNTYHLNA